MIDKTREDFERWAMEANLIESDCSPAFYSMVMILAWSAYQQGIADARKPSTETAAEWIARHEQQYQDIKRISVDMDVWEVDFTPDADEGCYAMLGASGGPWLCINLETADDCIKLCEILRVTPVERVVGDE